MQMLRRQRPDERQRQCQPGVALPLNLRRVTFGVEFCP